MDALARALAHIREAPELTRPDSAGDRRRAQHTEKARVAEDLRHAEERHWAEELRKQELTASRMQVRLPGFVPNARLRREAPLLLVDFYETRLSYPS